MCREYIFFLWNYTGKKTDYSYVIMHDAVKKNYLKIHMGPSFLRDEDWADLHRRLCNTLGWALYPLYLPKYINRKKKYVFLFNEFHPCLLNFKFIRWLKKRYDVKLVLVLRNMIKNKSHPSVDGIELNKIKQVFDLIVTDEEEDADLYNLLFLPDSFSLIYRKKPRIRDDVCFIGLDKGRSKLLKEIAQKAKENDVHCNIKIVGKSSAKTALDYQPYTEILKADMQANCILEILQPGQDSYTLRFQEAICLNKKLLTNNKNVKKEKYFNPEYIQIFEKAEDIDWDFVKKRIEVDYKYEGEYSPVLFLKKIQEELEKAIFE